MQEKRSGEKSLSNPVSLQATTARTPTGGDSTVSGKSSAAKFSDGFTERLPLLVHARRRTG